MSEYGDRTYLIDDGTEAAGRGARNTVGGWPLLGAGEQWPSCSCGRRMVFFFQLDIPDDLPPFAGDHLVVFHCPVHNEALCEWEDPQLPERFWEEPQWYERFWRIMLFRGEVAPAAEADPYLEPRTLSLRSAVVDLEEGGVEFRIGGTPSWDEDWYPEGQEPWNYRCPCGSGFAFLGQLPLTFGFETWPEQPEQPHQFSAGEYGLFLGNEIYLLACTARCHPAAVWPVLQS